MELRKASVKEPIRLMVSNVPDDDILDYAKKFGVIIIVDEKLENPN